MKKNKGRHARGGRGNNNSGGRNNKSGGGGGRNLKVYENVDESFRIKERKKLEEFRVSVKCSAE